MVLMVVEDRFAHSVDELIVSGVNPELDAKSFSEIRSMVGPTVSVCVDGRPPLNARVGKVDVSRSIIGRTNLIMSLKGILEDDVPCGALITTA